MMTFCCQVGSRAVPPNLSASLQELFQNFWFIDKRCDSWNWLRNSGCAQTLDWVILEQVSGRAMNSNRWRVAPFLLYVRSFLWPILLEENYTQKQFRRLCVLFLRFGILRFAFNFFFYTTNFRQMSKNERQWVECGCYWGLASESGAQFCSAFVR